MKFKSKLLAALTALSLAATCVAPIAALAANETGFVAEKTAEETVYISEDGEETNEPEYFEEELEEPEEDEEIEAAVELFADDYTEPTVSEEDSSVAYVYSDSADSGKYYSDFDSLVSDIESDTNGNEITDGMTIKLLSDATWTLTANKTIKIGLTFDLNGKTLTLSGNQYIQFQPADSTSKVAFTDSSYTEGDLQGKVVGSYSGSYGMIRVTNACTVELKNVYFENTGTGYAMETGSSVIGVSAENCEFVNSNTTSTNYSRGMLLYGSTSSSAKSYSIKNCKFKTNGINNGAALQVQGGGTSCAIEIDNCEMINNGTTTSAYALNFSSNLDGAVTVTNSTISAENGACAVFFNYTVKSTSNVTFGIGNIITGQVRFGNASNPSYVINVTDGCFSYTVDGDETVPFVAASTANTAVPVSNLLNLTGGYFKTDVSDVTASGYVCVANTKDVADENYNADYKEKGYTYTVIENNNSSNFYVKTDDGNKYYFESLSNALTSGYTGTVYFAEDYTLTDADIENINSKDWTVSNYGGVTLNYNGTLKELVNALTAGTIEVSTLSYKYDETTTHTIKNAEITDGVLTAGTVSNMRYSDIDIYDYYTDGILTDNYVYYATSYSYTVINKESTTYTPAATVNDILYCSSLGVAKTQASELSSLDGEAYTITLLRDTIGDIEITKANAKIIVDLNGYTMQGHLYITYLGSIQANNANVTVKNGTISESGSDDFAVHTNGTLTGITLTMENVDIEHTNGIAMYICSGGTYTITNCNISGTTALYARSGEFTITDTDVTATGEAGTHGTVTGGAYDTGDAIIFDASNYPGGAPVIKTFTGNTASSANAAAVVCYVSSTVKEDGDDDIQNKQFITDGTYNTDISKYVATGYYQNQTTGVVLKSTTNINNSADTTLGADDTVTIDLDKGATATVTLTNLAERIEAASADGSNTFTYDPTEAAEIYVVLNTDDVAEFPTATDAPTLGTDYFAVDISVVKKVNDVETEIPVTNVDVEVELPVAPDGNGVKVYHITGTDTVETVNDATLTGNVVSFTASSFSTYYFEYTPVAALAADDIATSVTLELVENGTGNYKIYLKGDSNLYINRFMAAELAFELDQDCDITEIGAVSITPANYINITSSGNGEYAFNVQDSAEEVSDITGKSVLLGYLTVTGNGKFRLLLNESPTVNTANQVQTAEISNNIVSTYITTAQTDNGKLNYSIPVASGEITLTPTSLTINVMFPNAVSEQNAEYNDMKVTVTGMGVDEEIEIGKDKQGSLQTVTIDGAETGTDAYTDATGYAANATVYAGYTYTLEFTGAGYRTFRTSVTPTYGAATVTVWNNAMDKDMVVVSSTDDAMGGDNETVTFLAGDIVANDKIDLWDLSAVVSYFGKGDMDTADIADVEDYIKYDLNRDGKIDSRDIAMVLVSWNY